MQYHEAATWLFDLRRHSPRTGVEHTRHLLDSLDSPDESYAVVQIAGSNGKGSTAALLDRVLREAGLDVGLYTSPHLSDVRERVQVNGRKMPKRALAEYVETVEPYVRNRGAAGESPTFFETVTGMALWEFDRQDVDVAILEVGIGGKHDATSATSSVASAVTSVTLEHADLLGGTEAEIARDKAHVATDRPLVTATTGEAFDAVRDHTDGNVLTVGGDGRDVTTRYEGRVGIESDISLAGPDWAVETRLAMLGAHQAENAGVAAALARQVGDELDTDVSTDDLARGLRSAHWPGRFEVMSREPLVVLDGAHNPGSCETLTDTLGEFDYDDCHLVVGAMSDKDHAGMAAALPETDAVYTCRPDFARAERPEVLAESFHDATAFDTVGAAVEAALGAAGPSDAVVVCGSLFVVSEARDRWTATATPKRIRDADDARAALDGADVPASEQQPAELVHETRTLTVRPAQARRLDTAMAAVGGSCSVSGLDAQAREPVSVVLSGTTAEFDALDARLRETDPVLADRVADDAATDVDYPWTDRTAVMGILNVTPDSFHDGGEYNAVDAAVERAEEIVAEGADIIDVGGESTRPGAEPVPVDEEIDRLVPVIEEIRDLDALISVDTRRAETARATLDAGADIINDVSGLADPGMRFVAAEYDVPVVVMHSINAPVDPDVTVEYDDVVSDTIAQLRERILLAERAGLAREQIIVDPGIGFGKSATESFELLDRTGEFAALGCPVLVGHSHKSLFERVDHAAEDRYEATVAGSAIAADRGADIVRVHDVAGNVAAVRVAEETRTQGS
ncbi:dihydropteroate synthase [Halosegnis longus]|uniref:Probable bifunctional folylpolyglutamate synthase/dihydropteroate synthase n=1 Tax=Halosegnis longus TaxID=2216012 RepID=A0AAJ4R8P9_9EURY|nr:MULTISPECIES: dihydropteroate synthase [Halobacteriales]RNJ26716.1 dihydropteroate synthase [Salella cibi]